MTRPEGTSPTAWAQREKLASSPKLCSWGPPSTTRRAPRREAITPSARSAANACRIVPRDTPYRSARSFSDGRRVPAGDSPATIEARRSSATLRYSDVGPVIPATNATLAAGLDLRRDQRAGRDRVRSRDRVGSLDRVGGPDTIPAPDAVQAGSGPA